MSNSGGKMYFALYHIKPLAYCIGNIILNLALKHSYALLSL